MPRHNKNVDSLPGAFEAHEIAHRGWHIRFHAPVVIDIDYDSESDLYVAEEPSIGVSAFNGSLEALKTDILDQLVLAWEVYAQADDSQLTRNAKQIKDNMQALVGEASRGVESEEGDLGPQG
jgi:hypothetical protein